MKKKFIGILITVMSLTLAACGSLSRVEETKIPVITGGGEGTEAGDTQPVAKTTPEEMTDAGDTTPAITIAQATQPETQPETRPVTKPATQPETRPVTKPATQPETRPVTKPATQPETQPETKPLTQPETTSVTAPPTTTPRTDSGTTTPGTEPGDDGDVNENGVPQEIIAALETGDNGMVLVYATEKYPEIEAVTAWDVSRYDSGTQLFLILGKSGSKVEVYDSKLSDDEMYTMPGDVIRDWETSSDYEVIRIVYSDPETLSFNFIKVTAEDGSVALTPIHSTMSGLPDWAAIAYE